MLNILKLFSRNSSNNRSFSEYFINIYEANVIVYFFYISHRIYLNLLKLISSSQVQISSLNKNRHGEKPWKTQKQLFFFKCVRAELRSKQ